MDENNCRFGKDGLGVGWFGSPYMDSGLVVDVNELRGESGRDETATEVPAV